MWAQEEWLKAHDMKPEDEKDGLDPSDLAKEMREGKKAAKADFENRSSGKTSEVLILSNFLNILTILKISINKKIKK